MKQLIVNQLDNGFVAQAVIDGDIKRSVVFLNIDGVAQFVKDEFGANAKQASVSPIVRVAPVVPNIQGPTNA